MSEDLRNEVALALGWKLQHMPYGLDTWIAPDGVNWAEPPHFESNIAKALLLWNTVSAEWIPRLIRLDSCYVAMFLHSETLEQFEAEAEGKTLDAAATAICKAWLPWKKAHG